MINRKFARLLTFFPKYLSVEQSTHLLDREAHLFHIQWYSTDCWVLRKFQAITKFVCHPNIAGYRFWGAINGQTFIFDCINRTRNIFIKLCCSTFCMWLVAHIVSNKKGNCKSSDDEHDSQCCTYLFILPTPLSNSRTIFYCFLSSNILLRLPLIKFNSFQIHIVVVYPIIGPDKHKL